MDRSLGSGRGGRWSGLGPALEQAQKAGQDVGGGQAPRLLLLAWLWRWLGVQPPGSRVWACPRAARPPLRRQEPWAGSQCCGVSWAVGGRGLPGPGSFSNFTQLLSVRPATPRRGLTAGHGQAQLCSRVCLARQTCRNRASGLMREPSASDGCPSHGRAVGTSSPSLVPATSPPPGPCFRRGARMSLPGGICPPKTEP